MKRTIPALRGLAATCATLFLLQVPVMIDAPTPAAAAPAAAAPTAAAPRPAALNPPAHAPDTPGHTDGHAHHPYDPPKGPPAKFTSGKSALDIPIELSSNHIYLPVTIGKSTTPAAIVLDTGGGTSAFDPEVVKAAGIKLGNPIRAMGAGGQSRDAWLLGDVNYSLPGVTLEDQSITAISFRHLEEATGRRMDGVLGYDFLRQFVVIIDYEGRKLHLHDPKSYKYSGAGHALPLTFGGPIPSVKATLNDTIQAEFMVDTGARMGVKASRMFVERAKLDGAANAVIEGAPGFGIGGATAQSVSRFDKLTVAGFDIPAPLVFLSRDSAGVFGRGTTDGVLGGDLWRRFTVILDYPNKTMYLEPNAAFGDLFEYDMSGLALRMDGEGKDAFLVSAVLDNSPAEAAGIQVGDRIEAVDETPVASMVLEDVRTSFREAGRTVQIKRRRGDEVTVVTLTLRRLI